MKKFLSIFVLLAALLTFIPSCSKDDDGPDDIKTQMIGTWDATAVISDGSDWIDITNYPSMALSITFNKDGSYSGRGALGNGSGTYTVSGKTIKTYVGGELYATYYVNSVSNGKAELKMTMGNSSLKSELLEDSFKPLLIREPLQKLF